jgi:hypothetical protein
MTDPNRRMDDQARITALAVACAYAVDAEDPGLARSELAWVAAAAAVVLCDPSHPDHASVMEKAERYTPAEHHAEAPN